jgi:hypothetical protein
MSDVVDLKGFKKKKEMTGKPFNTINLKKMLVCECGCSSFIIGLHPEMGGYAFICSLCGNGAFLEEDEDEQ